MNYSSSSMALRTSSECFDTSTFGKMRAMVPFLSIMKVTRFARSPPIPSTPYALAVSWDDGRRGGDVCGGRVVDCEGRRPRPCRPSASRQPVTQPRVGHKLAPATGDGGGPPFRSTLHLRRVTN